MRDDHKAFRKSLREADPAKPLGKDRAALLKARILNQAGQQAERPSPWLPRLALASACTIGLLLALWQPWSKRVDKLTDVVQTAANDTSPYRHLRETRVSELRFTTPSGTRIIWQFGERKTQSQD